MKFLSRAAGFGLLFCLFILIGQSVKAQIVVINEIAWMGTANSYNDEWIELYNNTGSSINLSDWKLVVQDGTPEINLTGNISAFGFYLLERTDDNTVPSVAADQIYTGALGNGGEDLILYENTGNITDRVSCASAGWFAGDNSTKQTMERINSQQVGISPTNWQTSQNSGGTPKAKNSVIAETPPAQEEIPPAPEEPIEIMPEPESALPKPQVASETTGLEPAVEPNPISAEPSPESNKESVAQSNAVTYPTGIIINEILPSPEGADETEEWIEIFNQNQFEVDLANWQIKDSSGTITTFTFPAGTKISAAGFLVLARPLTKIVLNNDADGISLVRPDAKSVETINYQKAPLGQSYSRAGSAWSWTNQLTPGAKNIISKTASQTEGNESTGGVTKGNDDSPDKKGLAAVGEQATKNNFFLPLTALSLAILSAVIIFILKRKINKQV